MSDMTDSQRRPFRRTGWRAAAVIAASLLVLAACSLTSVAYNNAVPLAAWYIDDYVDLQDEQREFLQQRLTRLIAWHRVNELPAYAEILNDAARRCQGPVSADDVDRVITHGRTLMQRLGDQTLGDLADFMLQLDAAQIAMLEAKLAADNEKLAEERIRHARDKRLQIRLDRYRKNYEAWLGTLRPEQLQMIAAALAGVPLTDELRLEDRKRLQAGYLELLKTRPPRAEFIARLRVLLLTPEAGRAPAYAAETQRWRRDSPALVAALVNSASPEQRQFLQRRLHGYVGDIAALARNV